MLLVSLFAVVQEDQQSSDAGGWVWLIIGGIIVGAMIYGVLLLKRRREALDAYLEGHRLTYLGNQLPPSMIPPVATWQPDIQIRSCYTGERNGLEIALFQTVIGAGESSTTRTMVAARRPPLDARLNTFLAEFVTVDSTSTPEWVIASYKGAQRKPEELEALFSALTSYTPR